ncbi:zincin-like metallopeptidase domain-containing protein [Mucilaginibacter sp. cycad4]|uniref:ArdC family protein n=1 Tax=Mucilaginibacter sp. cycad4 TaxID=3342096 RepID=UPI002AAAE279|nr:zincin-like metallopeptidase domain-containing protein [Mucilaginibacter gossypii]WPU99112.1 zincin-like metallopeptidase domain-containing protein [Mucilaginibacter gossypii]
MSDNFKKLPVQLSEKLAAELKAGTSLFQKPVKDNGMPAFVTPVNPTTGKGYSGMNQIILAMKGHDDPRWMSADAASYAGFLVKKGATGTMIEFSKSNDIQAVRTPEGAKIKDDDGKTITRTVEFEKPQTVKAFLFNGSQINNLPPLSEFLKKQDEGQSLSPVKRVEKLIADSKAVIIHGGEEAYYDKKRDAIFLPEKEKFESETKYLQAAIHQLAHWTGHESRLNRPMEGKFGSMEYAREEIRAAIAAMMIGGETKIGHNFGPHAAYSNNFQKILRDTPFEIVKVSRDAQKISSLLLGLGQKREVKQGAEKNLNFQKGDQISYMDTSYKVLDVYKNKSIKVEDMDGARKTIKATDGLYKSLLEVRNNVGEEQGHGRENDHSAEQQNNYQIER